MSCWWTSFFLSSFSLSLFLSCGFFSLSFSRKSSSHAQKFLFFPPPPPVVTSFFVSKLCFLQERGRRHISKNVWGGVLLLLSPLSDVKHRERRRRRRRLQQKRARARKRRVDKSGLERRPRKELALDDEKNMTRKEKIFALAKGFRGRAKNCFRVANQRVEKALQYAYRDRRTKKREARKEWIVRINAASREHGVKYAEFIRGIGVDNVCLDRKILAELAVNEPKSFRALCERVKKMRAAPQPLPKIEVREEEC